MRTRWLGTLTAVVMLAPAFALAAEAPHDASFSDDNCDNCHSMYNPTSGGGTNYSPQCYSCHNLGSGRFGNWGRNDQANPGYGGMQHSWDSYADNPEKGSQSPTSAAFAKRLADGKIQCSTCHDTHLASPENAPHGPDISVAVGSALPAMGNMVSESGQTGTGSMTLVAAGTAVKGYMVRIRTANVDGSAGTFIISHTFGLGTAATWLNWDAGSGTWVNGTDTGNGKPFTAGADVSPADTAVRFNFGAGVAEGDYWTFYVSYPFLRAGVTADLLCLQCHKPMSMNHTRTGGLDPLYRPDGVRLFSHPIGEALNANRLNHDRTQDNPDPASRKMLDATGVPQDQVNGDGTTGDGNATNDLELESGIVRCTTCHAVHNADSNSLTVDNRK